MPSAAEDAAALLKAFKGLGTNESVVTSILTHRTPQQIEEIKHAFHAQTGKDLEKEVESELSGGYLAVIKGILKGPIRYDAYVLQEAIYGLGTNEHALVEILVGRTNDEIDAIEKAYEAQPVIGSKKPHQSLAKDIAEDTSGDFKVLLLSLLEHRAKGAGGASVEADAEELFKAGEGKIGTNEQKFIEIFTKRSYAHLKEVFHHYENHHKHHSIVQVIDSEFSGSLKYGLKAIAQFVLNPAGFYAELFKQWYQRRVRGVNCDFFTNSCFSSHLLSFDHGQHNAVLYFHSCEM
eukprot:TRINITY_DN8102_c0_g1_i1.p2 TRINITY_DN8102_c0_g1~~TRINITY_DN8102_c0_g1_i1.p2  ORF type:complete len:292 (+),score=73.91 TRINITY_DN8102_c0_g1_i1:1494-2369(+)